LAVGAAAFSSAITCEEPKPIIPAMIDEDIERTLKKYEIFCERIRTSELDKW
jgi:hypothetical protein